MDNHSETSEFILLGFPGLPPKFHPLVSAAMFVLYVAALTANGTVMALITLREHLHFPMYLIISYLVLSDLLYDTVTLPKTISMYWFGDSRISFAACMFQVLCVHTLASFNSLIIMLMAFHRYVAICKPLRSPSMITNGMTASLTGLLLLIAAFFGGTTFVLTLTRPYCKSSIKVSNCFCTNSSMFVITCTDSYPITRIIFVLAMLVLLIPLALIIVSYLVILGTIGASGSSDSWQKAFYTCSTHLLIIGIYYTPRLFVYVCNQLRLIIIADLNILLLFLYTFVPHLANPIIYCLRTHQIKKTLENILRRNR